MLLKRITVRYTHSWNRLIHIVLLRPRKKCLGSHQLPLLIFTTKKEPRSASNTQSWETHKMHAFFWWYRIFPHLHHFSIFFWWEPKPLFFNLKKTKSKKKIACPRHFSLFFVMRTKTFIFYGLSYDEVTYMLQNKIFSW